MKSDCCAKCAYNYTVGANTKGCLDTGCECHPPQGWGKQRQNLLTMLRTYQAIGADVIDAAYLAGLEANKSTITKEIEKERQRILVALPENWPNVEENAEAHNQEIEELRTIINPSPTIRNTTPKDSDLEGV